VKTGVIGCRANPHGFGDTGSWEEKFENKFSNIEISARRRGHGGVKMRYLTIEREYGSGGTKIAMELAKRCRISCYGQEILEEAAKNLNTQPEHIRENEEAATNSFLYSIFMMSQVQTGNGNMLTREGAIFVEEQKIIQEFAKKGSAVFIGHCASEALKGFDDVIHVYIHADEKTKHERIRTEYGIEEQKISAVERKNNKRRANYYFANTQRKWNDLTQYDIVLDSSRLEIKGCVDLLAGLFQG